jgi:hypothetical protein
MSNQAFVIMPPRAVTGFRDPEGKTNRTFGKQLGSNNDLDSAGDSDMGIAKERRDDANSGPGVEVPCRRIKVWVWVARGGMT